NMCVAVSQSTRLCSISTVSQAKPARAIKRAAVMLPSDSQVPTEGWPAFRSCLTGLARMKSSQNSRRDRSIFVKTAVAGRRYNLATAGGADRAALAVLRRGHLVIIVEMRVFVFLVEAHFGVAGRVGSVV